MYPKEVHRFACDQRRHLRRGGRTRGVQNEGRVLRLARTRETGQAQLIHGPRADASGRVQLRRTWIDRMPMNEATSVAGEPWPTSVIRAAPERGQVYAKPLHPVSRVERHQCTPAAA